MALMSRVVLLNLKSFASASMRAVAVFCVAMGTTVWL